MGIMEFNTDLFRRHTIKRWIGHLKTLLGELLANPDLPLGELELLDQQERELLLVKWNDSQGLPEAEQGEGIACVHQLFEKMAQSQPANIALAFKDREMSYQELDQRSNQLAHYLQKTGRRTRPFGWRLS